MNVMSDTKVVRTTAGEVVPGHLQRNAVEVRIYEDEIPDFIGPELERLYETVYCTLRRFQIYGEIDNASTYVARTGGAITCIILFRIERNIAKVINQQIAIAAADLRIFVDAIFDKYPSVSIISFFTLDTEINRFCRPFQKFKSLEENIVVLPPTREGYAANLHQGRLKRIQVGERKLKRDHPGFGFRVLAGTEVDEQTLRQIVLLAGARMAAKDQSAYISEADIGKILQLIHACGFVAVLTIDGVIRGGNVFYGVRGRYFMHIIAHDPDYDKYMLGNLVQYWVACFCIERKGRECWLMGGGAEHKKSFGASPKYFDSLVIYRSRLHYLSAVRRVMDGAARHSFHRFKQNLLERAQTERGHGRAAARCLELARWIKQLRRGASAKAK
jgi:hypothetical protein